MSRMFTPEPELSGAPSAEIPETAATPEEFEFVLGKRQIASIGLVVLTAIGVCTAGAYIAGKATGKVVTVDAPAPAKAASAPEQPAAATPATATGLDAPLAGSPEPGKTYIQLASVERGYATLITEGARKLGFPAFIAPGTSPKLYRVLSGPFSNAADIQKAKAVFDTAGLNSFVRKYTESTNEPAPSEPATAPAQP
jgi:hypothetical protein